MPARGSELGMQREAGRISQMACPLPAPTRGTVPPVSGHTPAVRVDERTQTRASPTTGSAGPQGAVRCGQCLPGLHACSCLGVDTTHHAPVSPAQ